MTALTYIAPTARGRMSKSKIARIFLANEGRCHICGLLIRDGEKYEIDHITPLWAGGFDEHSAPAHVKCHAGKTAAEAPQRAKRNRIVTQGYVGNKAKRSGFRKPPGMAFDWKRGRYTKDTPDA